MRPIAIPLLLVLLPRATGDPSEPMAIDDTEDTQRGEKPIQMAISPEAMKKREKERAKTQTVLSNEEKKPEFKEKLPGLPVQDKKAAEPPKGLQVLDGSTFKDTIGSSGYTFVKFYAPWCGHCSEMAPDWEELAEHFQTSPLPGVSLSIGEVDCTAGMDGSMGVCMQEGVHGYPTVRLYQDGDKVDEYHFARTFDRMKLYLEDKLYDVSTLMPNTIGVYELQDLSFQKFLESSGSSPVLVLFYVPWCGHCKDLRETWDELAIEFLMEESEELKFAQVDCMDALDVCTDEAVESFPQIYMYKDGSMEDVFQGERNLEELSNFIWETVDPSRVTGGDDALDSLLAMQSMMGMGGSEETDEEETEDEEEDEEEEEDCDCSDPDCDCGDEDDNEGKGDEDLDDVMDYDEEDGNEDEESTEEELEYLEKMILEDKAKKQQDASKEEGASLGKEEANASSKDEEDSSTNEKENISHEEL